MAAHKNPKARTKIATDPSLVANRKCIGCNHLFTSTGPHNRHCKRCKFKLEEKSAASIDAFTVNESTDSIDTVFGGSKWI